MRCSLASIITFRAQVELKESGENWIFRRMNKTLAKRRGRRVRRLLVRKPKMSEGAKLLQRIFVPEKKLDAWNASPQTLFVRRARCFFLWAGLIAKSFTLAENYGLVNCGLELGWRKDGRIVLKSATRDQLWGIPKSWTEERSLALPEEFRVLRAIGKSLAQSKRHCARMKWLRRFYNRWSAANNV